MKRFLILGYPRSATNYAAIALSKVGFYVMHEKDESTIQKFLGRKKEIDGLVTGLFLNATRDYDKYGIIFHQTRDPIKVISSARHMMHRSMLDLWETCQLPGPPKGNKLQRVMLTYLKFTEKADKLCHMRYQVEQMDKYWLRILKAIDIPYGTSFPQRMNTFANTYGKIRRYTWDDLYKQDKAMAKAIESRAKEYGYEVDRA